MNISQIVNGHGLRFGITIGTIYCCVTTKSTHVSTRNGILVTLYFDSSSNVVRPPALLLESSVNTSYLSCAPNGVVPCHGDAHERLVNLVVCP